MIPPSRVRWCAMLYMSMILLAILCPVCPASVQEKDRRKQVLVFPAIYIGATVTEAIYASLIAAFGVAAVAAHHVTVETHTDHNSHSCENNRGWCRPSCFSHEKEVQGGSFGVCGTYKCCVSS